MKKELICILCPRGCRLQVDENLKVSGNFCPRGITYAESELTKPMRLLTSTVAINSKVTIRLSVKTSGPIPKDKMFECMNALDGHVFSAPVHIGDVLLHNVCNTGVDIVATMDILE